MTKMKSKPLSISGKATNGALAIFFRTHFWDECVEKVLEALKACTSIPVKISADVTKPFSMPNPELALRHDLQYFGSIGLPIYPNEQRTLWYNGDYPLYHFLENCDADYFIMVENDTFLSGVNLDDLSRLAIESDVEFMAARVMDRTEGGWDYHASNQRRWLSAEFGVENNARIFQSFFPFVFVSRRAVQHLKSRRLEMAKKLTEAGFNAKWPHAEAFVPTELVRAGFKIADICDISPGPIHLTLNIAFSVQEAQMNSELRFIHPVLAGHKLASKIICRGEQLAKEGKIKIGDWLSEQLSRNIDSDAKDAIRTRMSSIE
ncbi:MAG: hypothetical protein WCS20_06195 [Alphaproteobacteria bacterium]